MKRSPCDIRESNSNDVRKGQGMRQLLELNKERELACLGPRRFQKQQPSDVGMQGYIPPEGGAIEPRTPAFHFDARIPINELRDCE